MLFVDVDMIELVDDGAVFTEGTFHGVRFNASVHRDAAFANCTFARCSFFDAAFTGYTFRRQHVRLVQLGCDGWTAATGRHLRAFP